MGSEMCIRDRHTARRAPKWRPQGRGTRKLSSHLHGPHTKSFRSTTPDLSSTHIVLVGKWRKEFRVQVAITGNRTRYSSAAANFSSTAADAELEGNRKGVPVIRLTDTKPSTFNRYVGCILVNQVYISEFQRDCRRPRASRLRQRHQVLQRGRQRRSAQACDGRTADEALPLGRNGSERSRQRRHPRYGLPYSAATNEPSAT